VSFLDKTAEGEINVVRFFRRCRMDDLIGMMVHLAAAFRADHFFSLFHCIIP